MVDKKELEQFEDNLRKGGFLATEVVQGKGIEITRWSNGQESIIIWSYMRVSEFEVYVSPSPSLYIMDIVG